MRAALRVGTSEEDPTLPYLATASWRTPVRQLAEKARTNDLSPATLRESAAAAWEEYRTAALPAPGEDRRGAWLSLFDTALDALRALAPVVERFGRPLKRVRSARLAGRRRLLPGAADICRALDPRLS